MDLGKKIYWWNFENAYLDILSLYKKQWFAIINFLYFATIVETKLLEKKKEKNLKTYEEAIKQWDFLLPDGIALHIVMKYKYKKIVSNLNWTDFMPYLINKLKPENINLIFYWAYPQDIIKAKDNILKNIEWIEISYIQDGYTELERDNININPQKINMLLIWRWSPRQEIWAYQNIENIKKHWLLAFNVWGRFDFRAGKEVRAPKIIRKLKWEWVWRLITNPKKNWKKFLQSFVFLKFLLKKQP